MHFRVILAVLLVSAGCFAQTGGLRHFVSPPYPTFARQMSITGEVALELAINAAGDVKVTSVRGGESSPYPWLAASAKETVESWKYQPGRDGRGAQVVIYYSFSGETREFNPTTKVTADFEGSGIRVFVVTDAPAFGQPDASKKEPRPTASKRR